MGDFLLQKEVVSMAGIVGYQSNLNGMAGRRIRQNLSGPLMRRPAYFV